jgi:hypothetical protein
MPLGPDFVNPLGMAQKIVIQIFPGEFYVQNPLDFSLW